MTNPSHLKVIEGGQDQPPVDGISWYGRVKCFLRRFTGRVLNRLGLPGFIQPIAYRDALTGDRIKIRTSEGFTVLSVNGRDYWFRRLDGKFDGTGYGGC